MIKKTTLEEAIEKYAEIYRCPATNIDEYCKHDIISAINFGATWRQQNSYSEEEVFSLMCKAFEAGYKKYDVVEAGLEGLETEIECNWILKK
jgi:hypothetical protein